MCLRQSRKVIWDMIGQYTVPDTVAVESSMLLSLALSTTCPWPLVPFFQISLKNSELKTTHNTFRDCGMHFSDKLSRNSCIPNLRSIQSSRRANAFDRHSLAYTPGTKFGVFQSCTPSRRGSPRQVFLQYQFNKQSILIYSKSSKHWIFLAGKLYRFR